MKRLTLYTTNHHDLLMDLASCCPCGITVLRSGWSGKNTLLAVTLSYEDEGVLAETLMPLLQEIAMRENPVYRASTKLRDFAKEHIGSQDTCIKDLRRFISRNRQFCLEGYINFRMTDYSDNLNLLSYSLIKKYRLT